MNDRPGLLLLDLDGTVHEDGLPLPGAIEALLRIRAAGIGLMFVTNTTSIPSGTVLERLAGMGFPVDSSRLMTPLAAARQTLGTMGLTRVRALVREAALTDLAGLTLLGPEDEGAQAVLVGDLGAGWSYQVMNRAFMDLMDGARLVSCQANRYFRKGGRLVLDAGPFVAALEYAASCSAVLVGKPSADLFLNAARAVLRDGLDASLKAGAVWMIGDDLENDVIAARRAGLRAMLVRSGKYRRDDEDRAQLHSDAVLDGVASLPDWLGL
ncbi:MAG: HAD hydrolase-like protein [Candidatus Cloacimonetes bacterium]|nr:HAD hydrolase-like protein [Candidatus Cloacimonadota bacterium]